MLIYFNYVIVSQVLWVFHSWKAHSVHFQMRYNRPYYGKYLPRYFNKQYGQFGLYLLYRDELKAIGQENLVNIKIKKYRRKKYM